MAPKSQVGLFKKDNHGTIIWRFKSIAQAIACFGINRTSSGKIFVSRKVYTEAHSNYAIRLLTPTEIEQVKIDHTLYEEVKNIVINNQQWTIPQSEDNLILCNDKCQRKLPFTIDFFSETGKGGLRSSCRACRNEIVYERSLKKKR